jgi:hypothetical protein
MTPTPRLRFVERVITVPLQYGFVEKMKKQILQQWYAYDIDYPTEKGEWRDVPLEKEND